MDNNPFNICSLDPKSNCIDCRNQKFINCKFDKSLQKLSVQIHFSLIIIALIGLSATAIIINNWWIFIIYILFIFLFFFVIEIRLTCIHCPYYAENTKRLSCPENFIAIKIWRFRPEPMSRFERIGSKTCFIFIGGFPIIIQLYGIYYFIIQKSNVNLITLIGLIGIFIATIITLLIFAKIFLNLFCIKCINFSCPFNKVPKEIRNEYIKRNPILKSAWEKKGYKF